MRQNPVKQKKADDSPVDITQEANDIWSIARKLRGSYIQRQIQRFLYVGGYPAKRYSIGTAR